jgi:hypothetical protein
MLTDTHHQTIQRKKGELQSLAEHRGREQKKVADLSGKIVSAKQTVQRITSQPSLRTKLNEIGRLETEKFNCEKRVAEIENKMHKKQKEILDEEKRLSTAEKSEQLRLKRHQDDRQRKEQASERQREQEYEHQMRGVTRVLHQHEHYHDETFRQIKKMLAAPPTINVLFLASNPLDQNLLRLDEEARAIQDMIRKSKHRDVIDFKTRWAVRPLDILQEINETQPTIIHFSGHGSEDGTLALQRADGSTHTISKQALIQTISADTGKIKVIFFNTCSSSALAQSVTAHVSAAIGMSDSITDPAARTFAAYFYSAIGFGLTLTKAFEQAKAALMLEGIQEQDIPILHCHPDIDPNEIVFVSIN